MIEPGLYEQLLTEALRSELDSLDGRFNTSSRSLHTAEAADRIALHLSRRIQRTLASVGDSDRVQVGIEVARDLIARLAKIVEAELAEAPVEPGTVLHAVLQRRMFTRLRADDRAFWFLGPATYRSHVGEKPMAITWELHTPLPGDLYQSFAAAVA